MTAPQYTNRTPKPYRWYCPDCHFTWDNSKVMLAPRCPNCFNPQVWLADFKPHPPDAFPSTVAAIAQAKVPFVLQPWQRAALAKPKKVTPEEKP